MFETVEAWEGVVFSAIMTEALLCDPLSLSEHLPADMVNSDSKHQCLMIEYVYRSAILIRTESPDTQRGRNSANTQIVDKYENDTHMFVTEK